MRLSQNREHANAAHVQTNIILEYAGSSLGAICSARRTQARGGWTGGRAGGWVGGRWVGGVDAVGRAW